MAEYVKEEISRSGGVMPMYLKVKDNPEASMAGKVPLVATEAVPAEGITVVEMVVVGRANDGPVGFGTYMDGPWMKAVTNLQLVLVPLTWVILIYVA